MVGQLGAKHRYWNLRHVALHTTACGVDLADARRHAGARRRLGRGVARNAFGFVEGRRGVRVAVGFVTGQAAQCAVAFVVATAEGERQTGGANPLRIGWVLLDRLGVADDVATIAIRGDRAA